MSAPVTVVDGKGHLLGRLSSIVAKQLLRGNPVVIVRCEGVDVSGSLVRNKTKYSQFLRKRTNTNPKKGPIHYRSPSRIVWRTIRGMLPHKTFRGQEALGRLQTFEGVPDEFATKKRMVVPEALRVTRLKPGRRYCNIGRLASEFGWAHRDLINRLEDARKVRDQEYYAEKKAEQKRRADATAAADLTAVNQVLEEHGFA